MRSGEIISAFLLDLGLFCNPLCVFLHLSLFQAPFAGRSLLWSFPPTEPSLGRRRCPVLLLAFLLSLSSLSPPLSSFFVFLVAVVVLLLLVAGVFFVVGLVLCSKAAAVFSLWLPSIVSDARFSLLLPWCHRLATEIPAVGW